MNKERVFERWPWYKREPFRVLCWLLIAVHWLFGWDL